MALFDFFNFIILFLSVFMDLTLPIYAGGLFYHVLDRSIHHFRGVWIIIAPLYKKKVGLYWIWSVRNSVIT